MPWQKRQRFWEDGSGEGPGVCQAGPDSQMWSLGLAPAPISQCRPLTGIVPLALPQGPEIGLGSCLPWEKGVARAGQIRGMGLTLSFSAPPPPVHLGGGVGSWRWLLPGGSNMLRQLLLGCVYPTASLPGETIFEKQYRNLDPLGVWAFCRGDCRPAGHPTPLLYPLEAELGLFLAGSPSLYLTWIPPAVISVKADCAILCLSFSGCRLSFTLGYLHVSHSSSTLPRAPHPNNQIQIALYWKERFCWSRQG